MATWQSQSWSTPTLLTHSAGENACLQDNAPNIKDQLDLYRQHWRCGRSWFICLRSTIISHVRIKRQINGPTSMTMSNAILADNFTRCCCYCLRHCCCRRLFLSSSSVVLAVVATSWWTLFLQSCLLYVILSLVGFSHWCPSSSSHINIIVIIIIILSLCWYPSPIPVVELFFLSTLSCCLR